MAAGKNEASADREIVLSRVFDAPREMLWKAWTDPKQVAQWWGPRGFSTQIEAMDVRMGGLWIHTMVGPDGARYPNKSRFTEVVPLERICYSHTGAREGGPGSSFEAVWTFTEIGRGRTELKLRLIFSSAADRDANVKNFGSVEGGKQALGRLSDLLQKTYGGKKLAVVLPSSNEVLLTRVFQAPIADVFHAFTDAKAVARWWCPRDYEMTVEKYDARPGGQWRMLHKDREGRTHAFRGEFREVVPGSRIVRTFEYEPMAGHVSLETMSFEATPSGTRVTILARFESQSDRDGMVEGGMEWGANQSFDRLEESLASGEGDFVLERTFDAPRSVVFEAWTKPEHLAQWMGPKGSQTHFVNCELRTGGTSFYKMAFNGATMWGKAFYREVTAPSRLVYVQHFADESGAIASHPMAPSWPREMLAQVAFEDDGPGKTRVTLRWSPITMSAEERDTFEKGRQGMTMGWGGSFDALAELLVQLIKSDRIP